MFRLKYQEKFPKAAGQFPDSRAKTGGVALIL